jgi:lipopolysaccharide assembly outer membrane protein LptD (OstA)
LFTGRFNAQMHFSKELVLGGRSLNHLLEPQLSFGYISDDDDQDENPLFIPNAAVVPDRLINEDIRVLLRNPSDRISEERLLIGAINNRFFAPPSSGDYAPRLVAETRIGGGYDFYRSNASNGYVSGGFYPNDNLSFNGLWGYDLHEEHPSEGEAQVSWRSEPRYTLRSSISERRHEFTLRYRYLRDIPRVFEAFRRNDDVFEDFEENFNRINQLSATLNVSLFRQLDVFGTGYLSLEDSSATEGTIGIAFLSSCACWELIGSIQQRTRPDDTRFTIELRLSGLGFQPITHAPEFLRKRDSVDDRNKVWDPPAP